MLVLVADMVMAHLFVIPLPAGIGTAIVGVPYFIWLIIRTRRRTTT
ncbi:MULTISPECIES: hypothetical protein [Microbacterium]|nr:MULTISPECIES: hypothetical protein [Microbacterium]UWF76945.1 hypothetical protein JSY13_08940 [Microbacterium neungamense]WCM55105.1 hypothetical protein JRG78_08950 [Microbacterium sp. EF45047]